MKILALHSENIKAIHAVEIAPNGAPVVTVGGRNGAGKSSVLDSIQYALGGTADVPDRPIRDGEERAEVVVTLDGLKVTRVFTSKGSRLVVENDDGLKYPSPQAMLDRLVGSLSFDPLAFAQQAKKEPKKAVETLRKLVGLDFAALDAERAVLVEKRAIVKRETARAEQDLTTRAIYPDAPAEPIDTAAMWDALRGAQASARESQACRLEYESAKSHLANRCAQTNRARENVAAAKKMLKEAVGVLEFHEVCEDGALENAKRVSDIVAARPEEVDLFAVMDKIKTAENLNEQRAANISRGILVGKIDATKDEANALAQAMAGIDDARAERLAAATFPVPGLSFDDGGVLYDGIPFPQCSSGEQLRVSVAMGLALNPRLRVVLIRDGSLLDADNLRLIGEMASAADAQVWIERVGREDGMSVVIEDGAVMPTVVEGGAQ